jgi:A/G-specific adenine glycosylase
LIVSTHPNILDSAALLDWFDQHGRHDLPWQQNVTPYRVWVSEIMLQQTQVSTVIPYYLRFMQSYPDVQQLAMAPLDAVLHHWTGLGYYARARNLHRTAQIVMTAHDGEFPDNLEALTDLPGIGRSTAGAILSLSMNRRGVILDGNVKRVLCRYFAIGEWSGSTVTQQKLWALAEASTPSSRNNAFTQAMMDLGATVCTRSSPACLTCPLTHGCQARARGLTTQLPASKPRKQRPVRSVIMLVCRDAASRVLLQQRPPSGIWGGLWSLPELADDAELQCWLEHNKAKVVADLPTIQHAFTHFQLEIKPLLISTGNQLQIRETGGELWYPLQNTASQTPPDIGLAAPVKKLLAQLANQR